jgi:hypothetical protein
MMHVTRVDDDAQSINPVLFALEESHPILRVRMKHFHHPAIEGASETAAALDPVSSRKSVFAHLLDALHESRRLQAARLVHHYRHLLQQEPGHETRAAAIQEKNCKKELLDVNRN